MKRILLALSAFFISSAAFAQPVLLNQYPPGFRTIDGSQLNKMVDAVNSIQGNSTTSSYLFSSKIITTDTPPAATTCGTSPVVVGSRLAGQVTMGTGSPTGCVLTFVGAYTGIPLCTVTWQTNIASMQYTVSNTAITLVQTGTSSNIVNWTCVARNGG